MEDIVTRLRKRAEIRRQIPGRKSVQLGEPDRIADLLDEAADVIDRLLEVCNDQEHVTPDVVNYATYIRNETLK